MRRAYEAVLVLDPAIEDGEPLEQVLEKLAGVVQEQGGTVDHLDRWGKRRLAYEIKGRTEGHYILLQFHGEREAARELERACRITDGVLRHLIVRQPEEKRKRGPKAPGGEQPEETRP